MSDSEEEREANQPSKMSYVILEDIKRFLKNRKDFFEDSDDESFDELFKDETIGERIYGLLEVFPNQIRDRIDAISRNVPKMYGFVRTAVWVTFTSGAVLLLPWVVEWDRFDDN